MSRHPESYGHWDVEQISELLYSRDWFAKQYEDAQRWRQELADNLAEVEKQRDLLGNELNKTRNGLDALGVAIADAGYEWTPSMRAAYEAGTK